MKVEYTPWEAAPPVIRALKPCPCCGGTRILVITLSWLLKSNTYIECADCKHKTKRYWRKRKAVKVWNSGR